MVRTTRYHGRVPSRYVALPSSSTRHRRAIIQCGCFSGSYHEAVRWWTCASSHFDVHGARIHILPSTWKWLVLSPLEGPLLDANMWGRACFFSTLNIIGQLLFPIAFFKHFPSPSNIQNGLQEVLECAKYNLSVVVDRPVQYTVTKVCTADSDDQKYHTA